jgi:hypothetical protein
MADIKTKIGRCERAIEISGMFAVTFWLMAAASQICKYLFRNLSDAVNVHYLHIFIFVSAVILVCETCIAVVFWRRR